MQMEATIKVEGKISKTNASYQTKDKNGIILMKMHLGKLLKDKETMAKLKEIDKLDLSDEEKAKKAQKIMPDYMKVEPEKELSVEFN